MKKTINKLDELYPCCPERLLGYEYNRDTEEVTIFQPYINSRLLNRFVGKYLKNRYYKIKLDKLGSSVWMESNGQNSVKYIGEVIGEKFGPEIEPIYQRLAKFLIQLKRQKFIELHCPDVG